jgi:hypothetical protein
MGTVLSNEKMKNAFDRQKIQQGKVAIQTCHGESRYTVRQTGIFLSYHSVPPVDLAKIFLKEYLASKMNFMKHIGFIHSIVLLQ